MSIAAPPRFTIPQHPVRRFSVDEYHRMIDIGILQEDDPFELIEGHIVPKMPNNPPHATTTQMVNDRLRELLPTGWCVRMQLPVTLDDSEPEPDAVVCRGQTRDYAARHRGPADIGLISEVSYNSLGVDRNTKARVYARAGVPIYWVISVDDETIEVFSDPDSQRSDAAYRSTKKYVKGNVVPLIIAGQQVADVPVVDLLP